MAKYNFAKMASFHSTGHICYRLSEKLAIFAHSSNSILLHLCNLYIVTKEWTAKVSAFMMNGLGVIALDNWNSDKLDLYNMGNKLQVLR